MSQSTPWPGLPPQRALLVMALGLALWTAPARAADEQPPVPPVGAGRPGYLAPRPEGLFPLPPVSAPDLAPPSDESASRMVLKQVRVNGNTVSPPPTCRRWPCPTCTIRSAQPRPRACACR